MSRNLKQLLNTKVEDLWESTELVSRSAEISKTLWDCVIPLVSSATLLTQGASFGLFAIAFAAKSIGEKPKVKLLWQECVILAALFAYIKSFKTLVGTDFVNEKIENIVLNFLNYLKSSGDFELAEAKANDLLYCFHKSQLAKEFNGILSTLQAGLSDDAKILTERVAWGTHRYLNEALASVTDKVPAFAQLYQDGWPKESDKYHSLDDYLKQIAAKPQETVFNESFTFQQIYVPLQVKRVDENGEVKEYAKSENLEAWAKHLLFAQDKQNQVLFVQGEPGRGKSVFCRMFADRVRGELHPLWTPILIRLRDISTFEKSFQKTLESAVYSNFVQNDSGWLTDKNTRYLFLLDGFDELLMEGRTSGGLQDFLRQVGQFQEDCSRSSEMGHRVLITGRSLALHSIERLLPSNIERVEILPMNEALQQQWFVKWESIVGPTKNQAFKAFLKDKDFLERLQELAQEPLLLYLLAAMHREGENKVEGYAGMNNPTKILIYEITLDPVLSKKDFTLLNRKLTGQETEDLQRILTEAGLCVVQSGGECASISMIEARLQSDAGAKALLEKAQKHLGESPLKKALATFYLQTGSKEGSVEFYQKSFGEFLFAKRIKKSLIDWTKAGIKRQEFYISDEQLDWEIYDLLGYGGLTPEIVEYLTTLLTTDDEFRPVELFQRLEDFYLRWCAEELIDAPPENLPQKKMRILRAQVKSSELGLRQVDIYAGLNVMILLLELNRYAQSQDELKAQIVFYACGHRDRENVDQFRLRRIIGYCHCIDAGAFIRLIGSFLSYANFRGADLIRAELSRANLSHANLRGADLIRANLSRANLSDANLSNADLSNANLGYANLSSADLSAAKLIRADLSAAKLGGANLGGANLSSADLSSVKLGGANLGSANLSNANLSAANLSAANLSAANLSSANFSRTNLWGADLSSADLSGANLGGANLGSANLSRTKLEMVRWDEKTNWDNVQGLKTAQNVPEALKQQLGLS